VADAHHNFGLSQTSTQSAGYHSANNAAMDSFVTNTADAFTNLATATASDMQLTADLAATNTTLLAQITKKDFEIARLQAHLQANGTCSSDIRPNHTALCHYNNMSYCWWHGWDVHVKNTSATCNQQATGHHIEATGEQHQQMQSDLTTRGGYPVSSHTNSLVTTILPMVCQSPPTTTLPLLTPAKLEISCTYIILATTNNQPPTASSSKCPITQEYKPPTHAQ
jgi:hypothetical protein